MFLYRQSALLCTLYAHISRSLPGRRQTLRRAGRVGFRIHTRRAAHSPQRGVCLPGLCFEYFIQFVLGIRVTLFVLSPVGGRVDMRGGRDPPLHRPLYEPDRCSVADRHSTIIIGPVLVNMPTTAIDWAEGSDTASPFEHAADGRRLTEKAGEADGEEPLTPASNQVSRASTEDLSLAQLAFPEGGREAWGVCVGSWLLYFVSFGFQNAFGVFQTYYSNEMDTGPLASPSAVSWIGSFQVFMTFFAGLLSSAAIDRIPVRIVVVVGAVLHVLSCMLLSISTTYWAVFLTQGLLQGVGIGILFAPALACTSHFFSVRRGLALGVVASGSSLGGVVWPIVLDRLIHSGPGFGWALRVCGFIILALLIVVIPLMKQRLPFAVKRDSFLDWSAFKHTGYDLLLAAQFFVYLGLFFLYVSVTRLQHDATLCPSLTAFLRQYYLPYLGSINGMSSNAVFYLASASNGASFFGRILAGLIGDRLGRFNVLTVALTISATIIYATIAAVPQRDGQITGSLFAIASSYGLVTGAFFALQAATVVSLVTNMKRVGTWIGMLYGVISLPALFGPPIGSEIFQHHSFPAALAFAGSCVVVGAMLMLASRFTVSKKLFVAV